MNIIEAFSKTAFITSSDLRAKTIVALVAGDLEICDSCGFCTSPNTVCTVCEDAWADGQYAREEELNFGRHDVYARF